MANSYIPKWQNISVNFSDANSMMDTAMGGISKAGTVFSKLRDDIIAEEQRAAEAAYKQQIFDENVKQFDLQQAWNRENAEAERLFRTQQDEKNHKRAKELAQLRFGLEEGARNKNTSAYNALNTFFMDSYKKTGDLVKAAEATRAFHNTNYGNVLFDEDKIFGNLASAVTQGYSPENRLLRDITTIQEGATAGKELAGINKTLKDSFNGYTTSDGFVLQVDANGNILPVSNTPERKQYLDLNNDKTRYAQIEQIAKDRLAALGQGPLEINRTLNDMGSPSAIDQERAVLGLASRNGVTKPNNIPLVNTYIKAADTARDKITAEDNARKDREKLSTPNAYNEAYFGVYDEAVKDGKDIFDVSKNPELNASIELLSEAMRKEGEPASEFKKILKRIKNHNYGMLGKFGKNDDITSEGLNHPVLKEARDKYLPNLGKPKIKEKSETPTPTATNNANSNPDILKAPSTEKLKNSDARLAATVIKNLKSNRYALQQIVNERDEKDRKQINDQLAYLDAAITSLQNNTPITVSNSDAYAYLRDMLNRVKIYNTTANAQGDAVFTQDKDVASRYLRLIEPTQ